MHNFTPIDVGVFNFGQNVHISTLFIFCTILHYFALTNASALRSFREENPSILISQIRKGMMEEGFRLYEK